jgi:hypothetical protein
MSHYNLSTSINPTIAPETFRLFFAGAGSPEAEADTRQFPSSVASTFDVTLPVSHTLADVVRRLPRATTAPVEVHNPFVNPDGTRETDHIRQRLATPDTGTTESKQTVGEFAESLSFGDSPPQSVVADTNCAVIGEWLAAAHAAGHADRFWHQIATSNYTPINPTDGYRPLIRALREADLATDVFGWVDGTDYGGSIDIYLLFTSNTLSSSLDQTAHTALGRQLSLPSDQSPHNSPSASGTHSADGTDSGSDSDSDSSPEGDNDLTAYIGIRSGYDFGGTRAFHSQLFGYTSTGLWLYGLGQKHSRRHTGQITTIKSDIKPWWEHQLELTQVLTHDLAQTVVEARTTHFEFADTPLSIPEFYGLLGIPSKQSQSYAHTAADRVCTLTSPNPDSVSAWTLATCLLAVLEDEYTSQAADKHLSFTFRSYAEIATDLILSPHSLFSRVLDEIDTQSDDSDSPSEDSPIITQSQLADEQAPLTADSTSQLTTVTTDELDEVTNTAQRILGEFTE